MTVFCECSAIIRFLLDFIPVSLNHGSDHEQWLEFADSLPRAPFIVWLASEVASTLITERPYSVSIDELIISVDDEPSGQLQHDAELFLEKQYHLYHYSNRLHRIIVVFRHVIQHKLLIALNNHRA